MNYHIEKLDYGYILTLEGERHAKANIKQVQDHILETISERIAYMESSKIDVLVVSVDFEENPTICI